MSTNQYLALTDTPYPVVSVHWLTITGAGSLQDFRAVGERLGIVWDADEGRGRGFYRRGCQGTDRCFANSEHVANADLGSLEVKGARLDCLELDLVWRVLCELPEGWRVTRIDFAWDRSEVSPKLLHDALVGGAASSPSSKNAWHVDQDGLSTQYVGDSHSSEFKLCVYDRRGYNRVELRLYQGWGCAALAHARSSSSCADWLEFMRATLGQFIAWGHPAWQSLIGSVDATSFRQRPVVTDRPQAKRTRALVGRYAVQLAGYVAMFGWDDFLAVVERGANDMPGITCAALGVSVGRVRQIRDEAARLKVGMADQGAGSRQHAA